MQDILSPFLAMPLYSNQIEFTQEASALPNYAHHAGLPPHLSAQNGLTIRRSRLPLCMLQRAEPHLQPLEISRSPTHYSQKSTFLIFHQFTSTFHALCHVLPQTLQELTCNVSGSHSACKMWIYNFRQRSCFGLRYRYFSCGRNKQACH